MGRPEMASSVMGASCANSKAHTSPSKLGPTSKRISRGGDTRRRTDVHLGPITFRLIGQRLLRGAPPHRLLGLADAEHLRDLFKIILCDCDGLDQCLVAALFSRTWSLLVLNLEKTHSSLP